MVEKEVFQSVSYFREIREEFDQHLESINANTNEIQANFAFLLELSKKIDKLSARVDELVVKTFKDESSKFRIGKLSRQEQTVFRAIYRLTEEMCSVTYDRLSMELGYSKNMVYQYVTTIIEKGVPVRKEHKKGLSHIFLDTEFRRQQTLKGIIGINSRLTDWF